MPSLIILAVQLQERIMQNIFTWRRVLITIISIAIVVSAFLIYALAGLTAQNVKYASPPEFVAHYANRFTDNSIKSGADSKEVAPPITLDYAHESELVHDVFFADGSAEQLVQLFVHPDKAQRIRVALAFAELNIKFTHDEASGYADKRTQFYADHAANINSIRNAHFEALIASAKEQTNNHIPYTIAWMPMQGQETVEVLAWSARHHSDWWVRRFSVFFVVRFGGDEALAAELLSSQTHDPDYRVRKEVLSQRFKRIMGN
jgi:hypothetical protein